MADPRAGAGIIQDEHGAFYAVKKLKMAPKKQWVHVKRHRS